MVSRSSITQGLAHTTCTRSFETLLYVALLNKCMQSWLAVIVLVLEASKLLTHVLSRLELRQLQSTTLKSTVTFFLNLSRGRHLYSSLTARSSFLFRTESSAPQQRPWEAPLLQRDPQHTFHKHLVYNKTLLCVTWLKQKCIFLYNH